MISLGTGYWWSISIQYDPNVKAGVAEKIQKQVQAELKDRLENSGQYEKESEDTNTQYVNMAEELLNSLKQSGEFDSLGTALVYGNGNGNEWFSKMSESETEKYGGYWEKSGFDGADLPE